MERAGRKGERMRLLRSSAAQPDGLVQDEDYETARAAAGALAMMSSEAEVCKRLVEDDKCADDVMTLLERSEGEMQVSGVPRAPSSTRFACQHAHSVNMAPQARAIVLASNLARAPQGMLRGYAPNSIAGDLDVSPAHRQAIATHASGHGGAVEAAERYSRGGRMKSSPWHGPPL